MYYSMRLDTHQDVWKRGRRNSEPSRYTGDSAYNMLVHFCTYVTLH